MSKLENTNERENTETAAGILADDMGLGKTLTMLALVLTNHWDGRPLVAPQEHYTRPNFTCLKNSGQSRSKRGRASGDSEGDDDAPSSGAANRPKRLRKKKKLEDFCSISSSSSEDEFDKMSKEVPLTEKFLGSTEKTFEKRRNPVKDIVFDISDDESDYESIVAGCGRGEARDRAALHPGLNVDGLTEVSSEDEEPEVVLHRTSAGDRGGRHQNPASVIFYSDSDGDEAAAASSAGGRLIIPPRWGKYPTLIYIYLIIFQIFFR